MKLAEVVAPVVSTQKHGFYQGRKTLLVRCVNPEGRPVGKPYVAVDRVQAGVGDQVLLMQEGSSARAMFGVSDAPVRSVIVGIVDNVETSVGDGRVKA
jgi:ethanolamine utilization protein EutN